VKNLMSLFMSFINFSGGQEKATKASRVCVRVVFSPAIWYFTVVSFVFWHRGLEKEILHINCTKSMSNLVAKHSSILIVPKSAIASSSS